MIAEKITVTDTPTTIQQLIATERSVSAANLGDIPGKCEGIMIKYLLLADTDVVTLTDPAGFHGGGSVTGARVLDRDNGLVSTSFAQFGIDKALLSVASGTLDIDLIINQAL